MLRPDSYRSLARRYDMTASRVLRPAHERLADLCGQRSAAPSGERTVCRVVDIGCGTGSLSAMLAARGMAVTGVDISPAMLEQAARNARTAPFSLVEIEGMPLPFASLSFDAAILSLVSHESDDEPETLLTEALRVAPVCFVLEWRMPERNLDLPARILVHAIERLAGKRHYRRFCNFARKGYLHGAAHRANARVLHEEALMGGTMVLAALAAKTALCQTPCEMHKKSV